MTTQPLPGRVFLVVLLGALSTVSPFSIDMYLPAFAAIARDFRSTTASVSLSVPAYFLGLALGQLFYGPVLDRFGRKKPLLFGLLLYILACGGCTVSHSISMLIAFRFLQALGGCVAQVGAMTMVRDFFAAEESAKIYSLLVLMIGLSPLLAPTAGGYISTWLGWHWIFIFLGIIVAGILTLVMIFLPEPHAPDPSISLRLKPMLATYGRIISNPPFRAYGFSSAFAFATLFIYVAGSPLIFMDRFHISPENYGLIFALLSVGFIGSNQLNVLLLKKWRSHRIYPVALVYQLIVNVTFLAGVASGWFGLTATILFFFLSVSSIGFLTPNATALALAPFPKDAGSASALLGFVQMGLGGLASAGVGMAAAGNIVPVMGSMAFCSMVAFLILKFAKNGLQSANDARPEPPVQPLPGIH